MLNQRLTGPALALLLLQLFSSGLAEPVLPKVTVAKDGRTFEAGGKPFVPFGVNYFRPNTGWAPQLWKQFDAKATRADLVRIREMGLNCARVFLSYGSFYSEPGVLKEEGLKKFDQFLEIAEQAGIYVHPAGLDLWEGPPGWQPFSVGDLRTLEFTEQFWKLFAARYRGRHAIFAYDLRNEPYINSRDPVLLPRWNVWLEKKYRTAEKIAAAWGVTNRLALGKIPVPRPRNALRHPELLDFQAFRGDVADEWSRRQVVAIKSVDPAALVTVGFLQSSVPALPWGDLCDTGFRPERQAKFLDFLEVHFYPVGRGVYEYKREEDELAHLANLEGIVREMARPGKPVVLAEFGWYGGSEKPKFDRGVHPLGTEEQQAKYLRRVVETSVGFVVGWLNWGLYDSPGAGDCSELTGLLRVDGTPKAWSLAFEQLARRYGGKQIPPAVTGARPALDWEASLTSPESARQYGADYLKAFLTDKHRW